MDHHVLHKEIKIYIFMKFVKLYEDFEWDFDFEEEEEYNDVHFKIGDVLVKGQVLYYWNVNKWGRHNSNGPNNIVGEIKHSSEVTKHPFGNNRDDTIPKDTYVFSIKKFWHWFKYDKKIKIEK